MQWKFILNNFCDRLVGCCRYNSPNATNSNSWNSLIRTVYFVPKSELLSTIIFNSYQSPTIAARRWRFLPIIVNAQKVFVRGCTVTYPDRERSTATPACRVVWMGRHLHNTRQLGRNTHSLSDLLLLTARQIANAL